MDLEEIRDMIRTSLRLKLAEESRRFKHVPRDFNDFRRNFRSALGKTGELTLAESVEDDHSPDGIFETIHEVWSSIEPELSGVVDARERSTIWNEAIEFYMPSVLDELGLDESVIEAMKR